MTTLNKLTAVKELIDQRFTDTVTIIDEFVTIKVDIAGNTRFLNLNSYSIGELEEVINREAILEQKVYGETIEVDELICKACGNERSKIECSKYNARYGFSCLASSYNEYRRHPFEGRKTARCPYCHCLIKI